MWAPNVGSDGQQLKAMSSSNDGTTWTTPVDFTTGKAGVEEWWDYWPQILVAGNTPRPMIFFTSERDASSPAFNGGNIWLFPPLADDVFRAAPIFSSGRSTDGNTLYDRFLN